MVLEIIHLIILTATLACDLGRTREGSGFIDAR